jgi:hypothetical protein
MAWAPPGARPVRRACSCRGPRSPAASELSMSLAANSSVRSRSGARATRRSAPGNPSGALSGSTPAIPAAQRSMRGRPTRARNWNHSNSTSSRTSSTTNWRRSRTRNSKRTTSSTMTTRNSTRTTSSTTKTMRRKTTKSSTMDCCWRKRTTLRDPDRPDCQSRIRQAPRRPTTTGEMHVCPWFTPSWRQRSSGSTPLAAVRRRGNTARCAG